MPTVPVTALEKPNVNTPDTRAGTLRTQALPGVRVPVSVPAGAFGEGTAKSLLSVGEVASKIYAEEKKKADEIAVLDFDRKLSEAESRLLYDPKTGALNRKGKDAFGLPEQVNGEFDKIVQEAEQGLGNNEQLVAARKYALARRTALDRTVQHHVAGARKVYDEAVTDSYIKNERDAAELNYRDPERIGMAIARQSAAYTDYAARNGMPEEWTKLKVSEAASKTHVGVVNRMLANADDLGATAYYKGNKDGFSGDDVTRVESALQRSKEHRERKVEKQINALNAITLAGFEPSETQVTGVMAAARGTVFEDDAKQMAATAKATGEFRRMVPADQATYLTHFEAQIRKDPAKFDVTLLGRLRTIHENQQRTLKESPIEFAVRQGFVEPTDPAAQPLNLAKPDQLGPALESRFDLARKVRATHGADFKPLTPNETKLLGDALKQAPAAGKLDYFARLQRATGQDYEGYSAIMAQIAPDDPVTAIAGVYAARNRTQAADLMVRGQSILRPNKKEDGTPDRGKLWPMPPEKDLRDQFARYERDAFAGHPQVRNDYYQAALAVYAAKSADTGDASGDINSDRWDKSIRLVTGSIEKWNGKSIVLPYDMERGAFKDGLYARIDQITGSGLLAEGVTTSKLKDLPLEPISEGKYVFRTGDGVLVGKDGKPIIIDFNAPSSKSRYKSARRVSERDLTAQDRYQ